MRAARKARQASGTRSSQKAQFLLKGHEDKWRSPATTAPSRLGQHSNPQWLPCLPGPGLPGTWGFSAYFYQRITDVADDYRYHLSARRWLRWYSEDVTRHRVNLCG